jgi:hypothetical protein
MLYNIEGLTAIKTLDAATVIATYETTIIGSTN